MLVRQAHTTKSFDLLYSTVARALRRLHPRFACYLCTLKTLNGTREREIEKFIDNEIDD